MGAGLACPRTAQAQALLWPAAAAVSGLISGPAMAGRDPYSVPAGARSWLSQVLQTEPVTVAELPPGGVRRLVSSFERGEFVTEDQPQPSAASREFVNAAYEFPARQAVVSRELVKSGQGQVLPSPLPSSAVSRELVGVTRESPSIPPVITGTHDYANVTFESPPTPRRDFVRSATASESPPPARRVPPFVVTSSREDNVHADYRNMIVALDRYIAARDQRRTPSPSFTTGALSGVAGSAVAVDSTRTASNAPGTPPEVRRITGKPPRPGAAAGKPPRRAVSPARPSASTASSASLTSGPPPLLRVPPQMSPSSQPVVPPHYLPPQQQQRSLSPALYQHLPHQHLQQPYPGVPDVPTPAYPAVPAYPTHPSYAHLSPIPSISSVGNGGAGGVTPYAAPSYAPPIMYDPGNWAYDAAPFRKRSSSFDSALEDIRARYGSGEALACATGRCGAWGGSCNNIAWCKVS